MPEELKAAKRLNKTEFETILNRYIWQPVELLEELSGLPAIDAYVVGVLLRGVKTGDYGPLEWIAQRLIGKVSEKVELQAKPYIVNHLDGTRTELAVKASDAE